MVRISSGALGNWGIRIVRQGTVGSIRGLWDSPRVTWGPGAQLRAFQRLLPKALTHPGREQFEGELAQAGIGDPELQDSPQHVEMIQLANRERSQPGLIHF